MNIRIIEITNVGESVLRFLLASGVDPLPISKLRAQVEATPELEESLIGSQPPTLEEMNSCLREAMAPTKAPGLTSSNDVKYASVAKLVKQAFSEVGKDGINPKAMFAYVASRRPDMEERRVYGNVHTIISKDRYLKRDGRWFAREE